MPHQFAVDEAQSALHIGSGREMGIKVRGVKPAHAQDAAALGLPRFGPRECSGVGQGPGGQRYTGRQAAFEQLTTIHTLGLLGILPVHREPSCAMAPHTVRRHCTATECAGPHKRRSRPQARIRIAHALCLTLTPAQPRASSPRILKSQAVRHACPSTHFALWSRRPNRLH